MFKPFLYSSLLFILFTSCNVPEDKRANTRRSNRELESNIYSRNRTSYIPPVNSSEVANSGDDNLVKIDSSGTSTNDNASFPEMKGNCTWSNDGISNFTNNFSAHLGSHYIICQSKNENNVIYIQVQRPLSSVPICFVPTHNYGSKSVYIGEPRCRILNSNQTIYKIELYVNRRNYQNLSVTGVMVMKDIEENFASPFIATQNIKIPDAYIFCSEYLDQYGDPSYCISFRNKAEYLHKQF